MNQCRLIYVLVSAQKKNKSSMQCETEICEAGVLQDRSTYVGQKSCTSAYSGTKSICVNIRNNISFELESTIIRNTYEFLFRMFKK